MHICYKIRNPKDLKEFAAESGLHLDDHTELGLYGLSSLDMNEDVTFTFNPDTITLLVANKGFEVYRDYFEVKDWDNIRFTLSNILTIVISNGTLFLERS